MERKYKLSKESIGFEGRTLYRIKALKSFSNVKEGDLGGYVESEDNLSQKDNCWIYDNAKVYNNAEVYEDAKIFNNAEVSDNAQIYGTAWIYDKAKVYGNAWVYDKAEVFSNAEVCGNAKVFGYATYVYDKATVSGNARINKGEYTEGEITKDLTKKVTSESNSLRSKLIKLNS